MIRDLWQDRFGLFLRSVIPADPAQLLFLAGAVCLVFAPRMRLWPTQLDAILSRQGIAAQQIRFDLLPFISLELVAILFSAMAGYFVCFWPGSRGIRRVLLFVFLPAVAGISLTFGRFAYVARPYSSILDKGIFRNPIPFAEWYSWTSTPGFHLALAGLLLLGIFTSRMIFGISSLPLTLPEAHFAGPSDPQFWRRVQFLVWVLVGPLFVSGSFAGAGFALFALSLTPHASAILESSWFSWTASFTETIVFLLIVLWIVGKAGREIIKSSIRVSEAKYLFLAAAFSIGIGVLISTGQYFLARSHWATAQFGNSAPPQIGSYFNFPDPLLFLMFFSALFEEVVFRGLLQTFFVRRYGQYRGIFLTGIVWAAYHFNSDALLHPNELGALSQLGFRLAMCLALGFVLSWLTLRSGSVLPAAIAHTFYNILVSNFGLAFPGKSMVWVGLWAILACILFRYWPMQPLNELVVVTPRAEPGVAI